MKHTYEHKFNMEIFLRDGQKVGSTQWRTIEMKRKIYKVDNDTAKNLRTTDTCIVTIISGGFWVSF